MAHSDILGEWLLAVSFATWNHCTTSSPCIHSARRAASITSNAHVVSYCCGHSLGLLLVVFPPHALDIHLVKHCHLGGYILAEFDIFFLTFFDVLEFDSSETFVQVFEELAVLFSSEKSSDQRFLLFFE